MKKLLSTLGLAVALMSGFAPSQAEAAISFVNNPAVPDGTHPALDTWYYDLNISEGDIFHNNDTITLTTTGIITGGLAPDLTWGLNLPGGGHSAIWTWTGANIVGAVGGTTITNFAVTSPDPSGPVVWSYNSGAPVGTSGPVPEPATVMLLGIGGLLAGGRKLYESRTEDVTA